MSVAVCNDSCASGNAERFLLVRIIFTFEMNCKLFVVMLLTWRCGALSCIP